MDNPILTIRFYEELNDFLPRERRKRPFLAAFHPGDTVKALIESLGVPHTEVDLILVNGESASFDETLCPGDRVSVYPVFESFDISALTRVRPRALRVIRFVLDVHLGRLAASLRMLGFDSLYPRNASDEELGRISIREKRILLTRDRGLLKRRSLTYGYCVRSLDPEEQLEEVVRRFDLAGRLRPGSICMRCNQPLKTVPKASVEGRVPPRVFARYPQFATCPQCGRLYWRGSHWEKMRERLERLGFQSLI